ncbi:hypothetical protein F4703DRAFT_1834356 [Phycomyces blakesleeanus]
MQHHHYFFVCLILMTFIHWECEAFDFKSMLFGQQEVPLGAPPQFGFPETPASRKSDLGKLHNAHSKVFCKEI